MRMINQSEIFQTQQRLQAHLTAFERVLWAGAPRRGIAFRSSDFFMIPFSIVWGGFAIFWEAMAWAMGAPWFFKLWGVPFVCVGLYMMVGRFVHDAWKRGKTTYGLTNERVLIAREGRTLRLTSLPLASLPEMTLESKSNGSGTIVFGPKRAGNRQLQSPQFEMIANARQVYDQIRQAQSTARLAGPKWRSEER